jgi:hypothetical protein
MQQQIRAEILAALRADPRLHIASPAVTAADPAARPTDVAGPRPARGPSVGTIGGYGVTALGGAILLNEFLGCIMADSASSRRSPLPSPLSFD